MTDGDSKFKKFFAKNYFKILGLMFVLVLLAIVIFQLFFNNDPGQIMAPGPLPMSHEGSDNLPL